MDLDLRKSIDSHTLGRRLQEARKARGWTQQDVADHLGVARTTIIAIEKGERRIRPDELAALATFYGRSINDLLRPGEPVAFAVQLRVQAAPRDITEERIRPAVGDFQQLCEDYLELERLTGSPSLRRYPAPSSIERVPPETAAEDVAVQERNRLGLGDGPLLNLRDVLENDVGLRMFYIDMPSAVSEMFTYSEPLGGCMAINRKHPDDRRRMSVCHGYGHFLTSRYESEVCAATYQRLPPHERFASAFASAFLMPEAGLRRRFHEIRQRRASGPTPADLLRLAHLYGVSPTALTLRLEDLRLLPAGTWARLTQQGFRVREAQALMGILLPDHSVEMLPHRYQYLAVEAFERDLITEGQLARFLRVDRVEARRVVEQLTSTAIEQADGTYHTVAIDLDQSLPVRDHGR